MVLVALFVNALVIKKNYLLQLGKKIANQVQHAMEVERKGNETQKGKLPTSAKLGRLFANTSLRKKNCNLLLYDFEGDIQEISVQLDYRSLD